MVVFVTNSITLTNKVNLTLFSLRDWLISREQSTITKILLSCNHLVYHIHDAFIIYFYVVCIVIAILRCVMVKLKPLLFAEVYLH